MFRQLTQFKREHGHCFVPLRSRGHPKLGAWLAEQVEHFHKGRLSVERQRALEELGFDWDFEGRSPVPDALQVRWEARLAELVQFQQQHGHMRVTRTNETSKGLMNWRDNQRTFLRKGKLSPERKARLDAIGFEWLAPGRLPMSKAEQNEVAWESLFVQLLAFKEAHGHCDVPDHWRGGPQLAAWVHRQRVRHRSGTLRTDRKERLRQVGFAWKSERLLFARKWERQFERLVAFQQQHGHLDVNTKNTTDGLMEWRDTQRELHRTGKLSPVRKARLDEIGFDWQGPLRMKKWMNSQDRWELGFTRLVAFKRKHGHLRVPAKKCATLDKWVEEQRTARANGSLSAAQITRLNAVGFPWVETYEALWMARYAELVSFHATHGHCRPSLTATKPDERRLAEWLHTQRSRLGAGKLPPARLGLLDALGWQEPPPRRASPPPKPEYAALWEQRYHELAAYIQSHGHHRIPKSQPEFKSLRLWVATQRNRHREGILRPELRERLEAMGFLWNAEGVWRAYRLAPGGTTPAWEFRFQQLLAFKERHGHLHLPLRLPENEELGRWASKQRNARRSGTLRRELILRLDAVGFEWNPPSGRGPTALLPRLDIPNWKTRLEELLAFRAQHDHLLVPNKYPPCPQLANWVSNTRARRKRGELSAARIEQLDALGFVWTARHGPRGNQR